MEERESSPSLWWGKQKLWVAVAALELTIILILAAGLAHLAAHHERGTEAENWVDGDMLASLGRVNRTLQAATKRWESCQKQTRALEANTSSLSSEMTLLNTRLRLKEFEIKGLEDEVTLLKNWTQMLQDVTQQQKEIISHLQQQQRRLPANGGLRRYDGRTSLALLITLVFLF